jgi:cytochrome c2
LTGCNATASDPPQARVPGSFMTFAGLPDDGERADVIAYLKNATAIPPAGKS